MKKTWLYLLAVLLLGGLCWYYFKQDDMPSYDRSEANFVVKDTDAIQTIFLTNLKNENSKLSRTADGWVLNDSMDARADGVSGLLYVLNKQYAEKPVPDALHNAAIKQLSANSTKIEIYTKEGKTHCFYVGQIPAPNNSTYMLTEGAKRPFIVKLPMENNFVGIRYFTSVDEWRSKHILYSKHPITQVELNYADSTQHSFTMQVKGPDDIQVNTSQAANLPLNLKRAKSYLGFLDNIYCTGFESQYRFKDSVIQKGKQMATFTLHREGKPEQSIVFYFKSASHDTKSVITMDGNDYDANYFFGLLNHRDIMIMNRNNTQTILRTGIEFFQEDKR